MPSCAREKSEKSIVLNLVTLGAGDLAFRCVMADSEQGKRDATAKVSGATCETQLDRVALVRQGGSNRGRQDRYLIRSSSE